MKFWFFSESDYLGYYKQFYKVFFQFILWNFFKLFKFQTKIPTVWLLVKNEYKSACYYLSTIIFK